MLKLNASYSKKVPAERDYSSKSYHASVEVELADSITAEGIRDKIRETFELVRASVENEIGETAAHDKNNGERRPPQNAKSPNDNAQRNRHSQNDGPASEKQLKLLFDLGNRNGVRINDLARERFNIDNYSKLSKTQCSRLIDELVGLSAKAA